MCNGDKKCGRCSHKRPECVIVKPRPTCRSKVCIDIKNELKHDIAELTKVTKHHHEMWVEREKINTEMMIARIKAESAYVDDLSAFSKKLTDCVVAHQETPEVKPEVKPEPKPEVKPEEPKCHRCGKHEFCHKCRLCRVCECKCDVVVVVPKPEPTKCGCRDPVVRPGPFCRFAAWMSGEK
ncbi:hypothetical protein YASMINEVIRUS_1310 [Yasminevirus sp. GU-2018]|uniref:Uncharacterized protein n=1 Tax=Yasminevirus sp. GU-2018 TaxID=2420051 RepID=A0A5K0U9T6_9VIRU|nr:hypothetical protein YASMINEVIRUS_1310 [Yasminevirus sp. GU-2018]